jgi:PilZ domain
MSYATSQYRTPDPARVDQRQEKRHIVLLRKSSVRKNSTKLHEAQIAELSIYGCRLFTTAHFSIGDDITVSLHDDIIISAKAVWLEKGRVGCRFNEPLDRDVLRRMTLHIG